MVAFIIFVDILSIIVVMLTIQIVPLLLFAFIPAGDDGRAEPGPTNVSPFIYLWSIEY